MHQSNKRIIQLVGLLAIALLAWLYGFKPLFSEKSGGTTVFTWLVNTWNEKNQLQHCFYLPFVMAFLVLRKRRKLRTAPLSPNLTGLVLVAFGLLLYLASIRTLQPRLAVGGFPFVIVGAAIYLRGWQFAKHLVFPVALIFFTVPVPGIVQATNGLQLFATKGANALASIAGVETIRTGNQIQSAAGAWGFDVAEGCSGVRSLLVMLLGAAIYGHLTLKKVWQHSLLFLLAVPIAVLANCLRISSVVVIAEYINADLAGSLYHDYSTWIFFAFGFASLVFASKIISGSLFKKAKISRVASSKPSPVNA
jgi:exosortase